MNPVLTMLAASEKDSPKAIPELEESLRVAARTLQRSLGSRAGFLRSSPRKRDQFRRLPEQDPGQQA